MDSVMLSVKYGIVSAVFKVGINQCFSEVLACIRLKLNIGMDKAVILKYSVPSAQNCILESDEDLKNLFAMAELDAKKSVEVIISTSRRSICDDHPIHAIECSTASLSSELADSGLTEVSTSRHDAPLLSTTWAFGLREVGQRFPGAHLEFKATLIRYAAEKGFEFAYVKNNKKVVTACCVYKMNGCKWFIRASFNSGHQGFEVRKFDSIHDCDFRLNKVVTSKRLSQAMVAEIVKSKLRDEHTRWKSSDVLSHMSDQYAYNMSYLKAWRSLRLAKKVVFGEENESFSQLNWYVRAAQATNPESLFVLDVDNQDRRFKRLFVAWGGSVMGYRYVRPMISLDATFLTGRYVGTLLVATAKTGNQELFPIAYAIAYGETTDNWEWFLSNLHKVVGHDGRVITFFSDRNPGLLNALPRVFPTASHYFCLFHLRDNLRKAYGGRTPKGFKDYMVSLFNYVAYAPTMELYNKHRALFLEKGGVRAQEFLQGIDPSSFANVFTLGCRYGETTSSASESFNAAIRLDKSLPLIRLVDALRVRLTKWMNNNKKKIASWEGVLTKRMDDRLEELAQEGRRWSVKKVDTHIFEVISEETYVVNLQIKTCTCCLWPIIGFPCAHVVSCVRQTQADMSDFIVHYYFLETHKKAFDVPIMPIPTSMKDFYSKEEDLPILPPVGVTQAGRPPIKRKRGQGEREDVRQMVCSRCKTLGYHNKRTCTIVLPSPQA